MFRSCLVLALRSLIRQRRYSAINIIGLAVGIACCLLIALAVDYELGYDDFHDKGSRIYRLFLEDTSAISRHAGTLLPATFTEEVRTEVPQVAGATGYIQAEGDVGIGLEKFDTSVALVDPQFLEIFSFPLLAGDASTALVGRDAIVIGESLARRIFESDPADAIGRTVQVNGTEHVVQAIMANVPERSSLQFDSLIRLDHLDHFGIDRNTIGETTIFVESHDVDAATFATAISALVPTHLHDPIRHRLGDNFTESRLADFRLGAQPLTDIHFDSHIESHYARTADASIAYVMSAVALLILIVACINFATLTIASSARRAREIGVRKVVGARRRQLALQFWGETALLCSLAFFLGLGLADLSLPLFAELAGQPLSMGQLAGWRGLSYGMGILVITVIAAGSYPALQMSRERPVNVLQGSVSQRHRSPLLQVLLVGQYSLGIAFVIGTLTMIQQVEFVLGADLGFDPKDVVVVYVPGENAAMRFQEEASALSSVVSTTASDRAFTNGSYTIGLQNDDESWGSVRMIRVDDDFIETLQIELLQGRDLDANRPTDRVNSVLVNESTVRRLGWDNPVGRTLPISDVNDAPKPTIVGVVKDFHIDSLHRGIQPLFLTMNPAFHGLGFVMVRMRPGVGPQAMDDLAGAWQRAVQDEPFQASLLKERLEWQYRDEATARLLLSYAAGFIVLISCLGLLGHTALTAVRRTKEVGIRKALGASATNIVTLLGRDSLSLLVIACAVGWPAAWWMMEGWLEGFAYRIDLGPLPFLAGTSIALVLALVVVVSQSAGAAMRSPVVALRHD